MIQREKIFEENCCGLGLCVKQTLYCTRPGLIDFFIIDEKLLKTEIMPKMLDPTCNLLEIFASFEF